MIQRVSNASVSVDGKLVSQIGNGLLVLLGVTHGDSEIEVAWLTQKIIKMRIFSDNEDKMNLSLQDIGGEILVVSQFTLYGEAIKGNRPSFSSAAAPDLANRLYEKFMQQLQSVGIPTFGGIFGADMQVNLTNDGPVTILLERNSQAG